MQPRRARASPVGEIEQLIFAARESFAKYIRVGDQGSARDAQWQWASVCFELREWCSGLLRLHVAAVLVSAPEDRGTAAMWQEIAKSITSQQTRIVVVMSSAGTEVREHARRLHVMITKIIAASPVGESGKARAKNTCDIVLVTPDATRVAMVIGEYAKAEGIFAASPVGESKMTPSEWKASVETLPEDQLHSWRHCLPTLKCEWIKGAGGMSATFVGDDTLATVWLRGAMRMTEERAERSNMIHAARLDENRKRRQTAVDDA